ncbi:hypothetical protein AVW14_03830 [Stenotrophomonas maltophilia]|nr:hypothetical protein AVW14_03830 [Stenotrophomonas maltophilia]
MVICREGSQRILQSSITSTDNHDIFTAPSELLKIIILPKALTRKVRGSNRILAIVPGQAYVLVPHSSGKNNVIRNHFFATRLILPPTNSLKIELWFFRRIAITEYGGGFRK